MADIATGINMAFDNYNWHLGSYGFYNYFSDRLNDKYKVLPQAYTGPQFDDLTITYGYGALTAGHLDLTMSYKTFGTLGQGLAADQNTYDDSKVDLGVLADWKGAGVQNMAITFLPVTDNTDTLVTAKAKVMGKTSSVGEIGGNSYYYPYNKYEDNENDYSEWQYNDISQMVVISSASLIKVTGCLMMSLGLLNSL